MVEDLTGAMDAGKYLDKTTYKGDKKEKERAGLVEAR